MPDDNHRCSLSHTSCFHSMHLSFWMVSAWKDLRVRDPVFFFEARKATFLVAMASLKKMLFGLGSVDFREKDER